MNNQVTIILFDTDEEYIVNFNEYLREHQSERYLIITFNSCGLPVRLSKVSNYE